LHLVGFLLTLNYDARNHALKKMLYPSPYSVLFNVLFPTLFLIPVERGTNLISFIMNNHYLPQSLELFLTSAANNCCTYLTSDVRELNLCSESLHSTARDIFSRYELDSHVSFEPPWWLKTYIKSLLLPTCIFCHEANYL
jgi:hypothetical protein